MKLNKSNLKAVKINFDLEVNRSKLTRESASRYQSWVRRYLRYCKNIGVAISKESSCSFLQSYEAYSTRRQGFYALKFFFVKVLKFKEFINFKDTVKVKTWNKKRNKNYLKYLFFNNN